MKIIASVILALTLCGCATDAIRTDAGFKPTITGAQEKHDLFVGKWHGSAKTDGGGEREWLVERMPNGMFQIELKATTNGAVERQTEYGVWGVSGSIYFTATQGFISQEGEIEPADTTDANLYDAYEILEATQNQIRYRGLETGNEFTVTRVSSDFSL